MISLAKDGAVKVGFLNPGQELPLLVEPAADGVDLLAWARENRGLVESNLLHYGGILFRGFGMTEVAQFEAFIRATSGELLEYKERSSPRSQVEGNIYTSTDHPPHQRIFMHNENSYAHAWPLKIYFFGHTIAQQGGETPIADVRKVFARIPESVRAKFQQKGVLYVRNFGDGIGLPWQTVFQTTIPAEVEEYCRQSGYEFTWKDGGGLRIKRHGPAIARHPVTQELIWFNHATFFHVSTLEPALRDALLSIYEPEDLPNNTYYGDGESIEPEVLNLLREAYEAETIKFPWQHGDIMLLDNMLVGHAREPFVGQRKTLVGMSEMITRDDLPAV